MEPSTTEQKFVNIHDQWTEMYLTWKRMNPMRGFMLNLWTAPEGVVTDCSPPFRSWVNV